MVRDLLATALAVALLTVVAWVWWNYNEIAFFGCVIHAKFTDPPPVRTDGLCFFEYLLRDGP
jgi:hypothetical protein